MRVGLRGGRGGWRRPSSATDQTHSEATCLSSLCSEASIGRARAGASEIVSSVQPPGAVEALSSPRAAGQMENSR
jgi:hypothetical protein